MKKIKIFSTHVDGYSQWNCSWARCARFPLTGIFSLNFLWKFLMNFPTARSPGIIMGLLIIFSPLAAWNSPLLCPSPDGLSAFWRIKKIHVYFMFFFCYRWFCILKIYNTIIIMKKFFRIVFSLAGSIAFTRKYHVSVHGNDMNDGTIAAPFRTISHAAREAVAGDVIVVHEERTANV